MDEAKIAKIREEAAAKHAGGLAIYEEIMEGKRGIEDREQADALIKESQEMMKAVSGALKAAKLDEFFNEGVGSLTAGGVDTLDEGEPSPHGEWKSTSEFFAAVTAKFDPEMAPYLRRQGLVTDESMERLETLHTKALEEGTGEMGGYLSPTQYRPELYMKPAEATIVRSRATVIPMTTTEIEMPSLDQSLTPDEQKSAFFGGVNFEYIEEREEKPEQEIKFKLISLRLHELAGKLNVPNRLIRRSAISLDAMLRNLFNKAIWDAEDYWFLQGDGVAKPMGVIHSPATIQVTRTGAGAIVWADIIAMLHAFEPGRGVWVAHICTMEQFLKLKDENSNYMWIPNMRDGMPERLMGYPITWSEKASALGSKGDVGLYDFSYYLIGSEVGGGPAIESSPHQRFSYNETVYRISMNHDGKPWLSAPVPLRPDGTNEISPFVTLDTYGA